MSKINVTKEQSLIINSGKKNIVVQALAGTGKTTTLVETALNNPNTKYLYLAFNKAIVEEAERKFPSNVTVKTVHSLAYGWFKQTFPQKDLAAFIPFAKLDSFFKGKNKSIKFPDVTRVNNLLKLFYASNELKLENTRNESNNLFSNSDIELGNLILNDLSDKNGVLSPTHDFYLKMYHLAQVQLNNYDSILFDESQDSNDVITSIVMMQKIPKIFVGDKHQAIYQFRGSRDALTGFEKSADEVFYLTQTFRYGDNLAKVASDFLKNYKGELKVIKGLDLKTDINIYNDDPLIVEEENYKQIISQIVLQNIKDQKQTCFIAYKNMAILSLIEAVLDYNENCDEKDKISYLLNGDLSKYNFDMMKLIFEFMSQNKKSKEDGVKYLKIIDILKDRFSDKWGDNNLDSKGNKQIYIEKNSLKHLKDLFDGYKTTNDFVEHMGEQKKNKSGDDIYKTYKLALKLLKHEKKNFISSIEYNQRTCKNPQLILTTAHISKGLEWDSVVLHEDLFNEKWNTNEKSIHKSVNLNSMKKELKKRTGSPFGGEFPEYPNWVKLEDDYNQQANLIYVSMTRAKKSIFFSENLVDKLNLKITEEVNDE